MIFVLSPFAKRTWGHWKVLQSKECNTEFFNEKWYVKNSVKTNCQTIG